LMYGHVTVDGMNEKGFQSSGLYLAESDYGVRDPERPGLQLANAIQYLLDSFATVAEAVSWIESSNVQVIPIELGGRPGTGHISLADAGGDSAIVEFIDGRAEIHHSPAFTVMANSPVYEEQLVLQKRYAGLGGDEPLPGGTGSEDRFARAAYYSANLPHTSSPVEATAHVFSVIRNASAPYGTADEARPNISTTRWRTVADLTTKRYFFEWTMSPSLLWVNLDRLAFDGGEDLVLDVESESLLAGDVTGVLSAA
jgi:penicillin V acylase-like amidase (Ntn superfamily)